MATNGRPEVAVGARQPSSPGQADLPRTSPGALHAQGRCSNAALRRFDEGLSAATRSAQTPRSGIATEPFAARSTADAQPSHELPAAYFLTAFGTSIWSTLTAGEVGKAAASRRASATASLSLPIARSWMTAWIVARRMSSGIRVRLARLLERVERALVIVRADLQQREAFPDDAAVQLARRLLQRRGACLRVLQPLLRALLVRFPLGAVLAGRRAASATAGKGR